MNGAASGRRASLLIYLLLGLVFGVIITKGEVISWYRVQEMFRFQGFHMFGIFMTAVPTALIGVQVIKRSHARTLSGEPIVVPPKVLGRGIRYIAGGILFGIGWALVGACPGPLFALLGSGIPGFALVVAAALAGTWTYAALRPNLPH